MAKWKIQYRYRSTENNWRDSYGFNMKTDKDAAEAIAELSNRDATFGTMMEYRAVKVKKDKPELTYHAEWKRNKDQPDWMTDGGRRNMTKDKMRTYKADRSTNEYLWKYYIFRITRSDGKVVWE